MPFSRRIDVEVGDPASPASLDLLEAFAPAARAEHLVYFHAHLRQMVHQHPVQLSTRPVIRPK
tara:strand:- start:118 stop:306 length:189 start_codon:yes stop_codon:yes gene_type:complete